MLKLLFLHLTFWTLQAQASDNLFCQVTKQTTNQTNITIDYRFHCQPRAESPKEICQGEEVYLKVENAGFNGSEKITMIVDLYPLHHPNKFKEGRLMSSREYHLTNFDRENKTFFLAIDDVLPISEEESPSDPARKMRYYHQIYTQVNNQWLVAEKSGEQGLVFHLESEDAKFCTEMTANTWQN